MIADSVGFVVDRGREAGLRRRALLRRLPGGPRLRARDPARGARGRRPDARPVRHERRDPDRRAGRGSSATSATRSRPIRDAAADTRGIHTHNDAELAVANSMAAVAGRRPPRPGDDQRLRRALRQRQHGHDPRQPRAQDAARARAGRRRRADRPDGAVAVGRRDRQPGPERLPALRRPLGVRPQGRRPRRRGRQGRAELPAHRPDGGRQRRPARRLELGGRANTPIRAEQLGHQLEGVVDPRELSTLIKQLEADGLAFEGAEASFELLIRRHQADYAAPFRIVDYTCLVEQRDGRELLAEATVKVEVDGEVLHTAADGNGPVNALDAALRKALRAFYPGSTTVHLVDYKVRILDGGAATAPGRGSSSTRPTATREWSTMGSDTNIIAASASALADSLEYAIWKSGAELRRRDERHFTTPSRIPGEGGEMTAAGTATRHRSATAPARPLDRDLRAATPRAAAPWSSTAGDHHWRASAEGNGAVDALFRAVDRALADVLTGHPRLIAYDVHAVAEGPDAEGARDRPDRAAGRRGGRAATGRRYNGRARPSTNIIAASIEAYLEALNALLAEAHWAGATEIGRQSQAGRPRRSDRQQNDAQGQVVRRLGRAPTRRRSLERDRPRHPGTPPPGQPAEPAPPSATRIAFQGEPGAFSEEAVLAYFGRPDRVAVPGRLAPVFEAITRRAWTRAWSRSRTRWRLDPRDVRPALRVRPADRRRGDRRGAPGAHGAAWPDAGRHRPRLQPPQGIAQADEFLRTRPWQVMTAYNTAGSAKMIRDRDERGAAGRRLAAGRRAVRPRRSSRRTSRPATRTGRALWGASVAIAPRRLGSAPVSNRPPKTTHRVCQSETCRARCTAASGPSAPHGINIRLREQWPSRAGQRWEYVFWADLDALPDDPACAAGTAAVSDRGGYGPHLGTYRVPDDQGCLPASMEPVPPAFDLVIEGGEVIDGSGGPAVRADVGVVDGRIAAIGISGAAARAASTPAAASSRQASSTSTAIRTSRCSPIRPRRARSPRA